MFGNPVLFSGLGIQWRLAVVGGIVAGFVLLITALMFVILFKHTGARARRLDPAEAGRTALYGSFSEYVDSDEVIKMDGVGVGVELSVDIDSLRKAARRGDWLTFWLWPAMMSSFAIAIWTGLFSFLEALGAGRAGVVITTSFIAIFLLLVWFLPWAAIYTNIDLTDDAGAAVNADPGPDSPLR